MNKQFPAPCSAMIRMPLTFLFLESQASSLGYIVHIYSRIHGGWQCIAYIIMKYAITGAPQLDAGGGRKT